MSILISWLWCLCTLLIGSRGQSLSYWLRVCGACEMREAPDNHFPKGSYLNWRKARQDVFGGEAAYGPMPSLGCSLRQSGVGQSHLGVQSMAEAGGSCSQNVFTSPLYCEHSRLHSKTPGICWVAPTCARQQLHYFTWQCSIIFSCSIPVVFHVDLLKLQNNFRTTIPDLRKSMMKKKISCKVNNILWDFTFYYPQLYLYMFEKW